MVRLNFDGACHPNPGLAAWGCVIVTDTHTHAGGGLVPGEATNNVAEYAALGNGIKEVIKLGVTGEHVECVGDSRLVVNQVNGVWECREPKLKQCLARVMQLIATVEEAGNTVSVLWVPREMNAAADEQAGKAWAEAAGIRLPADADCGRCGSFVTALGQTEGVLCGQGDCPHPKLNWGVPMTPFGFPEVIGGQAEQTPADVVRGVPESASLLSADRRRPDVPDVPGGVGKGAAVGERGPSAETAVATAAARQVTA